MEPEISRDLGDSPVVNAVDDPRNVSYSFYGNDGNDGVKGINNKARVSFATAISQKIKKEDGQEVAKGALVFGKPELPLNLTSLDGTDMEKAENLNDLKGKYSVMEYFPNGREVDLLALYGEGLFDEYNSNDRMVKFNKTIVVVDREVTSSSEVDFQFGSGGVKLTKDYLYIFDGKEDKIAVDPITLELKSPSSGGGAAGGGGCNAGFGLLGLLPLVIWIARRRMTK
jgi:hypothetical protein